MIIDTGIFGCQLLSYGEPFLRRSVQLYIIEDRTEKG
jgi:hypothetical protein